jgi:hypothetical protein
MILNASSVVIWFRPSVGWFRLIRLTPLITIRRLPLPDKPLGLYELAYHSILYRRLVEPCDGDTREYSVEEFAVFADVTKSHVYKLIRGQAALTPVWVKIFNSFFAMKDPTDFEPQRCLMANGFMPVRIPSAHPFSGDRETLRRDFLQRTADALTVIIEAEGRAGKPTNQSSAAIEALIQLALEINERRKKGVL